jgi:hypothetical protein
MVYFGEELATFGYVVDFFPTRNFKRIFRTFEIGEPKKVKHCLCMTNHYSERCLWYRPGE